MLTEPFAETLEPRGESGLVSGRVAVITLVARAVSHAFDTRTSSNRGIPLLKAARTILRGFIQVKNRSPSLT